MAGMAPAETSMGTVRRTRPTAIWMGTAFPMARMRTSTEMGFPTRRTSTRSAATMVRMGIRAVDGLPVPRMARTSRERPTAAGRRGRAGIWAPRRRWRAWSSQGNRANQDGRHRVSRGVRASRVARARPASRVRLPPVPVREASRDSRDSPVSRASRPPGVRSICWPQSCGRFSGCKPRQRREAGLTRVSCSGRVGSWSGLGPGTSAPTAWIHWRS